MTIEIRDSPVNPDAWVSQGLATTWRERGPYFVSSAEGVFLEEMQRNPFPGAVDGSDGVDFRLEHDPEGPRFASTRRGSLRFTDESAGLMLVAALSKRDPATVEAVQRVQSGELRGLSVGMRVNADAWSTAADGRTALRTITNATLQEVSLVRRAANPQAQVTSLRHEQRSGEHAEYTIEYRSVPLELRADDVDERGDKYTAEEIIELGRAGKAFRHPDGGFSFPIADHEDLSSAIRAVAGRASKSPPTAIRRYIIRRARQLNLSSMIPGTWRADGTSAGSSRSSATIAPGDAEVTLRLMLAEAGENRLARQHRGATASDRAEQDRRRYRESTRDFLLERWTPRRLV